MRRSPSRCARAILAAAALWTSGSLTGCGGQTATTSASRPRSAAQLEIIAPKPNATVAADVMLEFAVQGATVSPPTKTRLAPDEGHIHVSLDGKLVAMTYGLATTVYGLATGPHTLQAEFVANDHRPFANRIVAAEIFTVG